MNRRVGLGVEIEISGQKCCSRNNKLRNASNLDNVKGVVHFKKKKNLLIIYSPPCHPRCPRLSFFNRKEIKVFDENIPGFIPGHLFIVWCSLKPFEAALKLSFGPH